MPLLAKINQIHVLSWTFSPSKSSCLSALTFHPYHHLQFSIGWHPIILTLMLKISKSETISKISHTSPHQPRAGYPTTVQFHTELSILQWHSTHPSHHQIFYLLQNPHRPQPSVLYVKVLWTQALNISHMIWSTSGYQKTSNIQE